MKTIYTYTLLICLAFFSSCQEEAETLPANNTKYQVKFNASGFTQTTHPFSSTMAVNAPNPANIKHLIYVVYNSQDVEVSRQHQIVGSPVGSPYYAEKLGCVTDSLLAGRYTVYIIASAANLNLNTFRAPAMPFVKNSGYDAFFNYTLELPIEDDEYWFNSTYRTKDTFMKKIELDVTSDKTQDVVLDRIVSKLELNILDEIDSDSEVRVFLQGETDGLRLWDSKPLEAMPWDGNPNQQGYRLNEGKKGTFLVLNTTDTLSVYVTIFRGNRHNRYGDKTFRVKFKPNQKTIITGRLLGTEKSNSLSVKINEDWGTDSAVVNF